ncbi:MAG TPA: sulfurtransferase TusA family protein [Candidatus Limnocylindrales bacterium]|jgi:tRNA 2-thiouridine synthesizing protein A
MSNLDVKVRVDASGLSCPMPILKAAQAVKGVQTGELVEIVATDPGSVKDFEAWARSTGNALVEQDAAGGKFRFVLRHK